MGNLYGSVSGRLRQGDFSLVRIKEYLRDRIRNSKNVAPLFSITAQTPKSLRIFLILLVGISLFAVSIENGLSPLMLTGFPIFVFGIWRRDYSRNFLKSETVGAVVFALYLLVASPFILARTGGMLLPVFMVHFSYGLLLVRVLMPLSDRNVSQIIFLTSGLIIVNCIITNHIIFGILLPVYVFTLISTLFLFQLARSRRESGDPDLPDESDFRRDMLGFMGIITGVMIIAAGLLFVFVPRPFTAFPGLRTAGLSGGAAQPAPSITYRSMLDMAGRRRIAFTINMAWGTLPDFPYWKGRVLERTDGQKWVQMEEKREVRQYVSPYHPEAFHYTFTPYKLLSNIVYTCGYPIFVAGLGNKPLYISSSGEVLVDSPFLASSEGYEIDAINKPLPATARQIQRNLDKEGVTPKIESLARQWTAKETSEVKKAEAIVSNLQKNFSYSLTTPPPPENTHALEYFLFESRSGHCEYFAGALCLLLRSIDIPARVVEGFAGMEPTSEPDRIIVRFSKAHAWVEAVLGDNAWTTLDAVPPSEERDRSSSDLINMIQDLYDTLDILWTKNVVYFDRTDQAVLFRYAISTLIHAPTSIGSLSSIFVVVFVVVILMGFVIFHFSKTRRKNPELIYSRVMPAFVKKGILDKVHPWHETNALVILKKLPELSEPFTIFNNLYLKSRFGKPMTSDGAALEKAADDLITRLDRIKIKSFK